MRCCSSPGLQQQFAHAGQLETRLGFAAVDNRLTAGEAGHGEQRDGAADVGGGRDGGALSPRAAAVVAALVGALPEGGRPEAGLSCRGPLDPAGFVEGDFIRFVFGGGGCVLWCCLFVLRMSLDEV